jgi:hypothetical protein
MMKTLRFHVSVAVVALALAGAGASEAEAQPTQQSPSSSAALDDKARELFRDGVKAAERSQWTKAHASFLAAWSLKQHYQILGNLGTSEAMLGKWRDAAEHLSRYLREAPKEKVEERKSAEALLTQARTKVGAITVRVEPAGAEVFVDGKAAGKAPLEGEMFVEPGAHVVEAKLEGYAAAKKDVSAGAGAAQAVEMRLAPAGAKGSGQANGVGRSGGVSEQVTGNETGGEIKGTQGGPRKAVIITGIAATSVALVGGAIFSIVSSVNASEIRELGDALAQKGNPNACSIPMPASECMEIKDRIAARDTFGNLAVSSFIVGGVLAASTAAYVLITRRPEPNGPVKVTPVAASNSGGLVVSGTW